MVRSVDLYYNNRTVSDLTELKNKFSMWKKIGTRILKKAQTDLLFTFDFPIDATNFMVEFVSFYDNPSAAEKVSPKENRKKSLLELIQPICFGSSLCALAAIGL